MQRRRNGFTLIELLVVITIIGILVSVVVIAINPLAQFARGRDAQRKTDLTKIQAALEQYRYNQSAYPTATSTELNTTACPTSSALSSGSISYMTLVPCDPKYTTSGYNGGNYYYALDASGNYTLAACLENASDTTTNVVYGSSLPSNNTSYRNDSTCTTKVYYVLTDQ